jgi:integrase
LSEKDVRVATAKREQAGPTLDQVKHVIALMPTESEIQRRDRTLIAFTILTGARDSAIASMKLKHVNLASGCVEQDAREVQTKFSKTFTTFFFPVGDEIRQIVAEWIDYLRKDKLWGNDDPLFPATHVALGAARQFEVIGLERAHWRSAARIRKIFRNSFVSAGLPYFNPHSFRNTLVRLGQAICRNPEEFKAWSQNLGHDKVLTTFLSYGQVEGSRQGEIIRGLAAPHPPSPSGISEFAKAVVREMRDSGMEPLVK